MNNPHQSKKLGSILRQSIKEGDKLSVIASYFTIYGFNELKEEFSDIEDLRLILSSGLFNFKDRDLLSDNPKDITGDKFEFRF
jgi:hypothetical protein